MPTTARTPRIGVVFLNAHTHAGKPYARGDELLVLKLDAAWLVAQGVARFIDANPPASPRTPSAGDIRRTDTTGDNHHGS